MASEVKLSVILFTFNRVVFLGRCIDAILSQSFKDFSLSILDNHSTDGTEDLINSYTDPRINYIRFPSNLGPVASGEYAYRNLIVGEFVLMTHDDDMIEPQLFEKEIQALEKNVSCALVSPNIVRINSEDQVISGPAFPILHDLLLKQFEYIKLFVRGKNYVCTPGVMFRGEYLRRTGIVPSSSYGPASDVVYWSLINSQQGGGIVILSEVLYRYRIHSHQASTVASYGMMIELDEKYYPFLVTLGQGLAGEYRKHYAMTIQKRIGSDFLRGVLTRSELKRWLSEVRIRMRNHYQIRNSLTAIAFLYGWMFAMPLFKLLQQMKKRLQSRAQNGN